MAAFISIISLVAAVLQIILFFKIWGMCNDIKAMRQQSAPPTEAQEGISINTIIVVTAVLILFVLSLIWLI